MDPNATWNRLLAALSESDPLIAVEAAEDLVDWLCRGGFPPEVLADLPPAHPLQRHIARFVCEHVLVAMDDSSQ